MMELPTSYMNHLADHTIFISALLGGFSLTVLVMLLNQEKRTRVYTAVFCAATIGVSCFLISIFSMTNILMKTTEGYPLPVSPEDLTISRILGILCFYLGLIAVNALIGLVGWMQSKWLGWFTTLIAIIVLMSIFVLSISVG